MANNGQYQKHTQDYVNEICQAFIAPHQDFEKIECRFKGTDGIGYIKLMDAADTASYFNITGLDIEGVCKLVARVIAGEETPELLTKYEERKEVAPLFR